MGRGVNMPWVGSRYTMGMGVNISWVGGRYTMVKGVNISWVGGSIYHGKVGQNTMGREGVQYILIIMGRGVLNFKISKKSKFSKKKKLLK